jgi:uncharacterized protein
MARDRVRRVLCAAEPRGAEQELEQLLATAENHDVQAIALIGDLSGDRDKPEAYRAILRTLGVGGLPAYWVPGAEDAPIGDYLREAHNMEIVFPFLHGVHGTAAFAPGYVLFAGFGGEVGDEPDGPRDELIRLLYPRWEPEYRLKLVRELKDYELVLLFDTPPAHKGRETPGSDSLAELVGTYRPRLVVCGGERGRSTLGRSMVVAPGSLADGQYAVADLHSREVDLLQLTHDPVQR